jgi:hypothetical protein
VLVDVWLEIVEVVKDFWLVLVVTMEVVEATILEVLLNV